MRHHLLKSASLLLAITLLSACTTTNLNQQSATAALAQGDTAPDFTLEDADGNKVTLSQINKPTLLVFFLGYDCPGCVRHLHDLATSKADFDKLGVQILAISPDTVAATKQSIQEYGDFPFPLLSDPDKKVAAAYGLVLPNDIMFHAIFTLTPTRQITFTTRTDHPYDNTAEILKKFDRSPAP